MNIRVISNKGKNVSRGRRITEDKKERKNKVIIFLCFVFFIGIVIGSIYFKIEINNNYFDENINFFEKENIENITIDKKEVFVDSLLKNMLILVAFWIIGLSIVGVPILVLYILYEGFSVAVTIIYVLSMLGISDGYRYIYSSMYLTTLLNVIAIIFLCTSAIRVTINIFKQKSDIKTEFIRHSVACLVVLILFVISSLNETFVSEFCREFIYSKM